MSAPDAETASSAGSNPGDLDLDALVARLREELRWGANGSGTLSIRARARSAAEQFWAVTAERPPHGPVARFLKQTSGGRECAGTSSRWRSSSGRSTTRR